MKIGVLADSFHLGSFAANVQAAAEVGCEGVQAYFVSGELAPENLNAAKVKEIRATLSCCGLELSAVCGDLGGHGFCEAADNPAKIERSKLILSAARECGTRVVTTHIGVVSEDEGCERNKVLREACFTLGEFAASLGMSFAIETGPETASTLLKFLREVGSEGMKVNLDPANFVMVTGQDPAEGARILRDHIVHTHAKDGKRLKNVGPEIVYGFFRPETLEDCAYFAETPLGEGNVDFPAYLAALREIGYDGYLTIEREVGDDPAKDIRLAAERLRGWLG